MLPTEDEEAAFYEAFLNDQERRMIAPPIDGEPCAEFPKPSPARDDLVSDGYLEASEILIRECMKSSWSARRLISPALFNLRHGLEIALKYHIEWAGGVVPKGVGHDLEALIEIFRKTAEGIPEEASYICEWSLGRVAEIASLDPRSLNFRYSSGISGVPIKFDLDRIGLMRLSVDLDLLRDYFFYLAEKIAICWDEEYLSRYR
jgi:hypothetical protein